jgi:catechol 2,3-dioxygenase-like lactoylglutathione lyase family enzyme
LRLNQVTVAVTDIARATDFYRKLGLVPVVLADHYARFACPDGEATFSIEHASAATPGDTVVYFECDDLDDRVTALKAAGVAFDTGPEDKDWLWREARLSDPDGNRLCLFFAGKNRLDPPWRV